MLGARTTDPETSHAAALMSTTQKAGDQRAVLSAHYRVRGDGLTDFELAAYLGRQQTSVGKRRGELRDLGLIEQTELRRPAPSGKSAIVWRITANGRRVFERGM